MIRFTQSQECTSRRCPMLNTEHLHCGHTGKAFDIKTDKLKLALHNLTHSNHHEAEHQEFQLKIDENEVARYHCLKANCDFSYKIGRPEEIITRTKVPGTEKFETKMPGAIARHKT